MTPIVKLAKTMAFTLMFVVCITMICPLASAGTPKYTMDSFKVNIDLPFNETSSLVMYSNADGPTAVRYFYDTPLVWGYDPRNQIFNEISLDSSGNHVDANARWFAERRATILAEVDELYKHAGLDHEIDSFVELSDTTNRTAYVFKRTIDTTKYQSVMASGYGGTTILYSARGTMYVRWFMADYSLESAKAMIQVIEDRCHQLWEDKPVLTLVHYGAFSPEALSNKAKGGDVIATLTDGGKPVAGQKVYFFLAAARDDNSGALFLPEFASPAYLSSYSAMHVNGLGSNLVDFGSYLSAVTDASGQATFNYVERNLVRYEKMEKWLREHGPVRYTVVAYVFEEPLEKTQSENSEPKIKSYGLVPIQYTSTAAIVNVREDELATVRVIRSPDTFPGKTVHAEDCPRDIMPGDLVLMPEGTLVTVAWLPGVRMHMSPKEEVFKEGLQYATFTIGSKDMGWTPSIIEGIKTMETLHTAALPIEILVEGHIVQPALIALSMTGISTIAEKKLEAMQGPIEITQATRPIYLVPHSRILIDLGNETTIYTLEGSGTVYNATGSSVNVATGNRVKVDQGGTLDTVSAFSESQLGEGQKRLITFAQGVSTATATPAPSGQPSVTPAKQSPAPGLLASALAIVAVVYLLWRRRGT